ncbi:MAG TPA: hypothetical protein VJN95_14915 [Gemmatimonadales bacterium]|nr:hypothetical protein [Gemmatimonadales bacterium]
MPSGQSHLPAHAPGAAPTNALTGKSGSGVPLGEFLLELGIIVGGPAVMIAIQFSFERPAGWRDALVAEARSVGFQLLMVGGGVLAIWLLVRTLSTLFPGGAGPERMKFAGETDWIPVNRYPTPTELAAALRIILADSPAAIPAMDHLVRLMESAGRAEAEQMAILVRQPGGERSAYRLSETSPGSSRGAPGTAGGPTERKLFILDVSELTAQWDEPERFDDS